MNTIFLIHDRDNICVALQDLEQGSMLHVNANEVTLVDHIPAKHKFALKKFCKGDEITMYGIKIGVASIEIPQGSLISQSNIQHAVSEVNNKPSGRSWNPVRIDKWADKSFNGFHRKDGQVGIANYWLVIPLVFCETKNLDTIKDALDYALGLDREATYRNYAARSIGGHTDSVGRHNLLQEKFPNVSGIRYLNHTLGCGGTRQDSDALCALLAGYIHNSNVAGATILSLGCQHAQFEILMNEYLKKDSTNSKPITLVDHQKIGTVDGVIRSAIDAIISGLQYANSFTRRPAPLSKLIIGLECGGSDGFSGISANPALGNVSDKVAALGGSVILSEFPELCGTETELVERCTSEELAAKFLSLMRLYEKRAHDVGSGFDMNPSPGNIKDGLITDAMKSAGAVKKGGSSPITDILDYTECVINPGLNLLCTPGNDVESTTAEVSSGANVVLFTTGLGTPTGNPIAPVIKLSSNTSLYEKMPDIIDINCGTIIDGIESLDQLGDRILQYIIDVANGDIVAKSVLNDQVDFIPWKRGVSL